jgi:hypothetical protein
MLVNEEGNAFASSSFSFSFPFFFFTLRFFLFLIAFFFVLEKNSTHAKLIELDAYVMYAYVLVEKMSNSSDIHLQT